MPLNGLLGEDAGAALQQVRAEPIQQRSAARLSGLLDAAAAVVDEVGFDRITTAMIAERAGASIGTVYRYYPDRVAVLHALHERAVVRFRQRVVDELGASTLTTWWDAVDCVVTAFVGLYRSEPGFRIVNFDDRDGVPAADAAADVDFFARRLADVLVNEFNLPAGPELIFRLEVAVEMADAILARAFHSEPLGEERFIAECRLVLREYLDRYYSPQALSLLAAAS
ncbi:TetR/AcrR family transcriptional regulator [Cryobacterium sp. TMS1-13-1]|uniref:TetR/AcrR family transcriptional regulator n=1 Tax=Cryobacterium sp. TMS1-13-1 TaxID=1259220 RepID=UPI00106CF805|nr:TetR/AcrR family transcriptional regulator [Cryobacterium sp. TMS1-13-1]TFD21673.1 TetR/AcrR family transcriptional regulator [Cryobacterium sp. TMS1-13-1]